MNFKAGLSLNNRSSLFELSLNTNGDIIYIATLFQES